MRPTITEQLDGLRRILAEIVAPEVQSPYPAEILGSVIGSLDALKNAWFAIPEYLRWDVEQTGALLNDAAPFFDPALAADIHADTEVNPDPLDLRTLEERQRRLHGLLVRAMPTITAAPALAGTHARMMAFFRERADRFPFAMAARPAPKKES